MSQRHVEILLGRLLTDEKFRGEFFPLRSASFEAALRAGLELSGVERSALASLDPIRCESLARSLDARLTRASIDSDSAHPTTSPSAGDSASQKTAPGAEGGFV